MKKLKVIMIDAFKLEYLKYAPYLSSLTKKYEWGQLEMPSGHWGGMEVFFRGKSDKLALMYRSERSSLRWTRNFYWMENFGEPGRLLITCLINFIRLLKKKELFRIGQIPLKKLYKFDFSIGKSLFYNLPVEFFYIGDLDKVGHEYGTKSREIINAIRKLDNELSKRDFDIILSDHGMSDIKEIISVPETEDCFIDSDMARYWGNSEKLEEIKKRLPLQFGRIIEWPNKKYGELIFLANTGVLISPNYWQGNKIVKAMHGYNGKSKEIKAFYIIKNKGEKKNLKVGELHKIFREKLENRKIGNFSKIQNQGGFA